MPSRSAAEVLVGGGRLQQPRQRLLGLDFVHTVGAEPVQGHRLRRITGDGPIPRDARSSSVMMSGMYLPTASALIRASYF